MVRVFREAPNFVPLSLPPLTVMFPLKLLAPLRVWINSPSLTRWITPSGPPPRMRVLVEILCDVGFNVRVEGAPVFRLMMLSEPAPAPVIRPFNV